MRIGATLLIAVFAAPAMAETAWDDIRDELYGARYLLPAGDMIAVSAPYRSENDLRVDIGATVTAPQGTAVSEVTLVLDENPMPVSAVFRMEQPMPRFAFETTFRVNRSTPFHVIAEMTDGRLIMTEGYIKTSGVGACSAPPGQDPVAALEHLGEMVLSFDDGAIAALPGFSAERMLDVDMSHPSHSGMQMDQISLLFIPMRYVERLDITLDDMPFAEVTGSISLAENPSVSITVPGSANHAKVRLTDTDGTVTEAETDRAGF